MIKAFVFDMDGVILDSETVCDKTWKLAAAEMGLKNISEGMKQCLGTNKNDTIVILKRIYGEDFDAELFLQKTSEIFHDIEEKDGIPLMPYAGEALNLINDSGRYRLALASSTRKASVERLLKAVNVFDLFESHITGDMVEHSKPNPEIYLMACKALNLKPEECIAVEDSPNGIKSAYAAGLKAVMVPDKIQPTEELKKLCWKIYPSLKEFVHEELGL